MASTALGCRMLSSNPLCCRILGCRMLGSVTLGRAPLFGGRRVRTENWLPGPRGVLQALGVRVVCKGEFI